ncbi:MAG TPA: GYD domain-containing protein [Candidatus Baltobacteraceae bacterium]|nr:GYD domain-containing protein [Candidatus Baltobacteraceae bacterium]
MPKYLVEATYTSEGVQGLIKAGGSARRKVVEDTCAAVGGKLEAFYFVFGDRDAVIIADIPSNEAAAALSMAVNATGALRTRTTPLLTLEEIDAAAKDEIHVHYRAPGT